MENVKYFFEELIRTEQASKLLASMKKPETEEQALHCYVELARELGCALTVEDITAYFAAQNPRTEVDDEELAQVAGGAAAVPACKHSFKQKENCWRNDGCDVYWNYYDGYLCSWHHG